MVDFTTSSSSIGCFAMQQPMGGRSEIGAFAEARWEPSPRQDLEVEPSAMDVIGPETSQAQIRVIYDEVYQLHRLPGRSPCNEGTGERFCQEILDLVKECLWHRWGSTQPEENQGEVSLVPGPLGCLPRWSLVPGCRQRTIISRICGGIHVRRPWQWLEMPTTRCWWQLLCWRAISRG